MPFGTLNSLYQLNLNHYVPNLTITCCGLSGEQSVSSRRIEVAMRSKTGTRFIVTDAEDIEFRSNQLEIKSTSDQINLRSILKKKSDCSHEYALHYIKLLFTWTTSNREM